MPQMYAHQFNQSTRLAVWHITEPESFFRNVPAGKEIRHPHKRLQHLCGRYLLVQLAPAMPLSDIVATQYNKPFLPGHPYHFSVSHSGDYAAAMVSRNLQVGIDVEMIDTAVRKIRHKFLTAEEEAMLAATAGCLSETERLTLAWSTKETLFKWLGETGVDFKAHLQLEGLSLDGAAEGIIRARLVRSRVWQVVVGFRIWNEVVLTWLET